MSKDAVFMLRLSPDMRDEVDEHAADMGISSSEWIRNAIDNYLECNPGDIPSEEEIEDMDRNELEELIDELDLGIDERDYDSSGVFGSASDEDTDELREAILTELGYFEEDKEDGEGDNPGPHEIMFG